MNQRSSLFLANCADARKVPSYSTPPIVKRRPDHLENSFGSIPSRREAARSVPLATSRFSPWHLMEYCGPLPESGTVSRIRMRSDPLPLAGYSLTPNGFSRAMNSRYFTRRAPGRKLLAR